MLGYIIINNKILTAKSLFQLQRSGMLQPKFWSQTSQYHEIFSCTKFVVNISDLAQAQPPIQPNGVELFWLVGTPFPFWSYTHSLKQILVSIPIPILILQTLPTSREIGEREDQWFLLYISGKPASPTITDNPSFPPLQDVVH